MSSLIDIYLTLFIAILTHNMVCPVKGQRTTQSCEQEDLSNGIVTEIEELFKNHHAIVITNLQMVDRQSQEQVQHIYELLNASFQQMKNHQDTVMSNFQAIDRRLQEQDTYIKLMKNSHEILNASYQEIQKLNATLQQIKAQQDIAMTNEHTVDRRSQEQVQSIREFLNTSFQQMENQHNVLVINFQAIDRRIQEQNTYTQQIASNHEILNASHQEIKASIQDIKYQQGIALTSLLQAVDQRSQEQIQSILEFINTSFQQMENKQETVLTSLRAVERRSLEQDICLSQIQSISGFFNASLEQMGYQQVNAMTSLVAIDRRLSEQDIFVRNKTEIELIKKQQDVIITNLQIVQRRSQEQIQQIYEFLNISFQQRKNHQDTVMINLHSVDRRLQEQDAYIKQMGNSHEILNASYQEIQNLNATLHQIKDQQDIAMTNLHAVDRRFQEQVQSIHQVFNTSFQQHDTVMMNFQTIERRFQEQNTYTQQIASNPRILNVSHQEIKASLQDIKQQQGIALTSLQAVDRRFQEQVQSIHQVLNTSFQQMANQHDAVMINSQAIDTHFQEQNTCTEHIASNHAILNASHQKIKASLQDIKDQQIITLTSLQDVDRHSREQVQISREFFNTSIQQMGNQQKAVLTRLDRRLNEHDIFVRNKTEIILQLINALGTGDWIVIMHRFDGSVNFNRTWAEYRNGFGDKHEGEFWLGNEEVHRLTNRSMYLYTLLIEVQLKTSGEWYYAEYSSFSLESEDNKYTLRLAGYSGNAGDSITSISLPSYGYLDGMKFSTSDNNNDGWSFGNCARSYKGGWWFNKCDYSCLTCINGTRFKWYSLNHLESDGLLQAARMMIKRH